jgi:selenocysteine lyase/cysteine desulfurase
MAVELAARQLRLVVKVIPIDRGGAAFVDHLRSVIGPRTRLLALSHVTTDTGTSIPVQAVSRLAHATGALLLLDGAHAVGQAPLDLHELDCDFYSSMGYKWAMGPMGTGFLYVRRASQGRLRSVVGAAGTRWLDLPTGRFEESTDAQRFEFASRPWIEFFALGRSLEFLASLGVAEIQSSVQSKIRYLRAQLRETRGAEIYTPDNQEVPTGIVAVGVAGVPPTELAQFLLSRNIVQRAAMMAGPSGGVRISVALYTTIDEIDRLVGAIGEIVLVKQ